MPKTMHGIIRGRTIQLEEDPQMSDGQEVEIFVWAVASGGRRPGDGLVRTEGALTDDPYWDDIMEKIYQERKSDARKEVVE